MRVTEYKIVGRWWGVTVLVAALLLAVSCSFRPLSMTVMVTVAPADLRPNPDLNQMGRFAIVVSNGLADSVSAGDVLLRNRDCLKLRGQVTFPLTLSQLYSGVSIPIPLGSFHIAIVGYSDAIGSPTTIAGMFGGTPGLKSFLIAEGNYNTVVSNKVQLRSTYVAATATELVTACPIPSPGTDLQTLSVVNNLLYWTRNKGGAGWALDEPLPGLVVSLPGFFVDADGTAHISFMKSAAGFSIGYANNGTGTFVEETVAAAVSDQTPSAVARDGSNALWVIHRNPDVANQVITRLRSPNGWDAPSTVMITTTTVQSLKLIALAGNNKMVASAQTVTSGNPIEVAVRSGVGAGTWAASGSITTAGGQTCNAGVGPYAVAADRDGYVHFVYQCANGTGNYLGYATDRTGTLTTYNLSSTSLGATVSGIALAVDPSGELHVAYTTNVGVFYFRGPASTVNFEAASLVYNGTDTLLGIQFKAFSHTSVAGLISSAGSSKYLRPFDNAAGWQLNGYLSNGILSLVLPVPLF